MLFLNKRNLGIGVVIFATSLAACALPDYQPPPSGGTSSGAGATGGDATGTGGMGTGGMGTGGTTSSSTSSSASTGSGGATEANCLDGMDDDGDGHADCADSDCQAGYECVPAPAQNFSDLLRLRVLGVGNAPVECAPGVNPVRRFKDPSSSECTACECTTLAQCGPFVVSVFGDSICSGAQADLPIPPGGCAPLANAGGLAGAIYVDPPLPLAGACQIGQSVQVTPEKFHTAVDVCQVPGTLGGGCDAGKVCVARAKQEYAGDGICVGTTGDVSCPGGFPNRIVAYSGGLDGRTCSQCTCEASQVECLGGGITVDKTNNCSGVPISIELQTCTALSNVGAQSAKSNPAIAKLADGACGGGAKDGSVQPQNPQTFCCAP